MWTTTGSYPQEFIIQLGSKSDVSRIKLVSTNGEDSESEMMSHYSLFVCPVRNLVVKRCERNSPSDWEQVLDLGMAFMQKTLHILELNSFPLFKEIQDNEGQLQMESNMVNRVKANFLKFEIYSAWNDFCTVHRVSIEGKDCRE